MSRDYRYEAPGPMDRPICSRFGSGTFPCGPVHIIRISTQSRGPRGPEVEHRRALCKAHHVFDVTKTNISGGPSGFKSRAMTTAMQRLAAEHPDEFQAAYEKALRELCATTSPPIDADILLGATGQEAS